MPIHYILFILLQLAVAIYLLRTTVSPALLGHNRLPQNLSNKQIILTLALYVALLLFSYPITSGMTRNIYAYKFIFMIIVGISLFDGSPFASSEPRGRWNSVILFILPKIIGVLVIWLLFKQSVDGSFMIVIP